MTIIEALKAGESQDCAIRRTNWTKGYLVFRNSDQALRLCRHGELGTIAIPPMPFVPYFDVLVSNDWELLPSVKFNGQSF